MLKIATFNANGIRSAIKKGLCDTALELQPDIICIQELKAQAQDLLITNQSLHFHYIDDKPHINFCDKILHGYYFWGHYAQKKGYSGVGIFTKIMPQQIVYGIDNVDFMQFNLEGRYIQADFEAFTLINIYFPSSSSEHRIQAKYDFLKIIQPHLLNLAKQKECIICADFNIAHQNIDLKNWKSNLNKAGCLPIERQFINDILYSGYKDIFRELYPNDLRYTWWSQRGQAFNNDVGWRIDYHLATEKIAKTCQQINIYKTPRLSDHAIVIANFN